GRNFQESLQKALRSMETGQQGLDPILDLHAADSMARIRQELKEPGPERIWYIGDAFRAGLSLDEVVSLTHVDPWFLVQLQDLVNVEQQVKGLAVSQLSASFLRNLKRKGFSDIRLGKLLGLPEEEVRKLRQR